MPQLSYGNCLMTTKQKFLHVKLIIISTTYYFQGVQDLIFMTERLKVLQIFCHISHRNRGKERTTPFTQKTKKTKRKEGKFNISMVQLKGNLILG